jgi:hypothetical protein
MEAETRSDPDKRAKSSYHGGGIEWRTCGIEWRTSHEQQLTGHKVTWKNRGKGPFSRQREGGAKLPAFLCWNLR